MAEPVRRDAQGRALDYEGQPESHAARDREKHSGFRAGKVGATAAGGADMPKQETDETPAAYGERLRKWRESKRQGKAAAVKGMLSAR